MTSRGLQAACAGLVLLGGCSHTAPPAGPQPLLTDLLRFPPASREGAGALPEGWKPHSFDSIPRKTSYEVLTLDGAPALWAESSSSASAVRLEVAVDPRRSPLITWTWKVGGAIAGADISRKETDDAAARLLILYRYDPSRVSLLERARYEAVLAARGEYPPFAMLVYAWTETRTTAGPVRSPHSDRVRIIPVEMGSARAGEWVTETRNHLEDFRSSFGEEPTGIEAVAFMCDTDDTRTTARAGLRQLRFANNGN